jgi:hypothetical protein
MNKDHLARDAAVAVSLANLLFLAAWRQVVSPETYFHCYRCATFVGWTDLAGLLVDVLLLAAALFAVIRLIRKAGSARLVTAAELALLASLLIPLNALYMQLGPNATNRLFAMIGRLGFAVLALAALGLALWVVFAKRKQVARGALALLLILSPFGLVAIGHGAWNVRSIERNFAARDFTGKVAGCGQSRQEQGSRPRVVWVVFDELDYEIAFAGRPQGFQLPELDRLRDESLSATNAFPPSGFTEMAVSSLLTGTRVESSRIDGPTDLQLQFAGQSGTVSLSDVPTIFTQARKRGLSTAAVGWYHPYCRLFGPDLCACYHQAREFQRGPQQGGLLDAMAKHARSAAVSIPALGGLAAPPSDAIDMVGSDPREWKVSRALLERCLLLHEGLIGPAIKLGADPNLDMVFLHLSVPHPPGFYDRSTGEYKLDGTSGYLDGLALADRALGEIRRAMEEAGIWNDTHFIVTSDHFIRVNIWLRPGRSSAEDRELMARRKENFRVPFLVKLAGPAAATVYEPPFNILVMHDLTLALLDGEVGSHPDLARWLDEHRTFGPVEYNLPGKTVISPPNVPPEFRKRDGERGTGGGQE